MNAMRHHPAHPQIMCDVDGVKKPSSRVRRRLFACLLLGGAFALNAETNGVATNAPATNAVVEATATKPEAKTKPTPPTGKLDFSSFKPVVDRNIFNGNRSGQRMTSTRSSTQQRSVRVEAFTLVGTLISERGSTALFDGTSSEFRKPLKAGGTIAGFTVKEILHAGVRLAEGTNTLDVRVGSGLRREDEGLWKPATGGSYASTPSIASNRESGGVSSRPDNGSGRTFARNGGGRGGRGESNGSTENSSAPASGGDVDAILKRLMEQREKE